MSKHSFAIWLHRELAAARCALLTLYEQRDALRFIEGPRLERKYMLEVGSYEERVIREEIECEVLHKKQQLIQAAINRREPIDEVAIDRELEQYRRQLLSEEEGHSAPKEYADLSQEQMEELQELYRYVVKNFHPEVNKKLTEVHRTLFKKAQGAYRCRDLEGLRLICEMLRSTEEDEITLTLMVQFMAGEVEDEEDEVRKQDYLTDYALAAEIFEMFYCSAEAAEIRTELQKTRELTDDVMWEMETLKREFPYTAAEMLEDPEKITAYKEGLTHRLQSALDEREYRMNEIRKLIESVVVHE